MRLPAIQGIIDRRILVNFTADADVAQQLLPTGFRPQLYRGKAIVGICLIRLKQIKPKYFPNFLGLSSENGAHRIAVEWEEDGLVKEGVYIPRRDTSSRINTLAGGRLFPGKHYLAKFNVNESGEKYHIAFTSSDQTSISIDAQQSSAFDSSSLFGTLKEASAFFERGAAGYSPNKQRLEGIRLVTYKWEMKPLTVSNVHSSFFEDEQRFPKGSIQFDNALLMIKVAHSWEKMKEKHI